MNAKLLFRNNYQDLLWMVNTEAGKYLCGIHDDRKIVHISPNNYHVVKDIKNDEVIYEGRFFCYEKLAKFLLPQLTKMQIYEYEYQKKLENKYDALLHFSGLERSRNLPTIYFTTDTYYAGAGDGQVSKLDDTNWAATRNAADGSDVKATNSEAYFFCGFNAPNYQISRAFFPSDTSSIPEENTISAASFVLSTENQSSTLSNCVVVTTNQTSTATLGAGDYSQTGSTSLSDEQSMTTAGVKTFTLTAGGIAAISRNGVTKLGVRNKTNDIDNVSSGLDYRFIAFIYSERASTTSDPYYSITHSLPGSTVKKGNAFLLNFI